MKGAVGMAPSESRTVIRSSLVVGLVTLALVLGGCGDDGRARVGDALDNVTTQPTDTGAEPAPAEQAPEETAPTEPQPETTAVPESEPEPQPEEPETQPETPPAGAAPEVEAPAETASDDDGLSTTAWVVILLAGLGVFALLMAALAAGRRRAEVRAEAAAGFHRELSDVVGRSRWLHDSGSAEVLLTTDRDQLTRTWEDVRTRMVDLESRVSTLAASSGDSDGSRDLVYLGRCVSDLRKAEEAYVTTQLRAPDDRRELTRTSTQTVQSRRQQLQGAIEPVAAALRVRR